MSGIGKLSKEKLTRTQMEVTVEEVKNRFRFYKKYQ